MIRQLACRGCALTLLSVCRLGHPRWTSLRAKNGRPLFVREADFATEKSVIEWVEWRAKQTPGPGGSYDVDRSFNATQEPESKGMRMGNTNIGKRYVDLMIEPRARDTPGPGEHDLNLYEASVGMSCLKTNGPSADGKGGFSFAGRPSVGELPAPFTALSEPFFGESDIRTGDHTQDASYLNSLTPWRASERYIERAADKSDTSISWLSEETMRKNEGGSLSDAVDYTGGQKRKLQSTRLGSDRRFSTARAFTMSVNAKRCAENFATANERAAALAAGDGGER